MSAARRLAVFFFGCALPRLRSTKHHQNHNHYLQYHCAFFARFLDWCLCSLVVQARSCVQACQSAFVHRLACSSVLVAVCNCTNGGDLKLKTNYRFGSEAIVHRLVWCRLVCIFRFVSCTVHSETCLFLVASCCREQPACANNLARGDGHLAVDQPTFDV